MRILIFFILISLPFIGSAQMTANGVLVATDASHANTDTDITFTGGNLLTVTQLKIATGSTIIGHLTATATLDFPSTAAGTCEILTITLTGAVDGDIVMLGIPNGSIPDPEYIYPTAWVSSANTISVKGCNIQTVTSLDPASGTFRASVIRY